MTIEEILFELEQQPAELRAPTLKRLINEYLEERIRYADSEIWTLIRRCEETLSYGG